MALVLAPLTVDAKGGGGRSGGSRSSSASRSVSNTNATKNTTPTKTVAPKPVVKTATSPTAVKSSTGKTMNTTGKVVDANYQPKFKGGYQAPAGSVVYYPQRSFIDYLPWIFLFSQNSGAHRDVVVQEPDGKQVTQKEEGVDSMYVWNWVFSIGVALGAIALVVWLMNRKKYV